MDEDQAQLIVPEQQPPLQLLLRSPRTLSRAPHAAESGLAARLILPSSPAALTATCGKLVHRRSREKKRQGSRSQLIGRSCS